MNDFIPLGSNSIVVASTDQVSAELGGETAILAFADGAYYGLSDVGAFIWRMLQKPVAVSAIVEAIVAEYAVAHDEAEHDLMELLRKLMDKKLIRSMPV